MSTTTLCAFCESLPERSSGQAAKTVRCPLCKTDLGVTASGVRFRVGAEAPAASHRGRHLAVAGGFGACALLSAMVVTAALWNRPAPPAPAAPARTPQLVPSTPTSVEDAPEAPAAPGPSAKPDKPASPPGAAKPAPHSAKPAALLPDDPPAVAAAPPFVIKELLAPDAPSEVERRAALFAAPEAALYAAVKQPLDKEAARKLIVDMTKKARDADKKTADGFVHLLMKERADLAGLPFLLGKQCRTEQDAARLLAEAAGLVREAADDGARPGRSSQSRRPTTPPSAKPPDKRPFDVAGFWKAWTYPYRPHHVRSAESNADYSAAVIGHGVAALTQILGPAEATTRMALVEELDGIEHALIDKALVKFALFDLDNQVRDRAVAALGKRGQRENLRLLVEGFRHPWPVVADNAAQALIKLDWREAAPLLIDFLESPDPGAPFVVEREGVKRTAVREMVRINHHRNCQLCHAPADGREGLLGLTPSQGEEMPPSLSRVYYAAKQHADLLVRADITYLRQDFSVMLPVADVAPWPELQRFDFLVRTRVLGEKEAAALAPRPAVSRQHQAALLALRELTGADFGLRATAWRESFATTSSPAPMPSTAPRAETILP